MYAIRSYYGLPVREQEGKRSARKQRMHPMLQLVIYLALFRILLFALSYALSLGQGYAGGLMDRLGRNNFV